MRLSHGTRVTTLVVLVVALTMACGFGALFTAVELERDMSAMAVSNLPSVIAANELQQALLQQRGIVAAYFLEGHPGWLNDLDRIKPLVPRWMGEARRTAHTQEERGVLEQLETVYAMYDDERERAIDLYAAGRKVEARDVLLKDVSRLAGQAQLLCDQLVMANERIVKASVGVGHRRVERLRTYLTIGMAASALLALALLVLVLRDLLRPMRRLTASARAITAPPSPDAPPRFMHEVGELEFYSQALISDVNRTRTSLEESRLRLLTAEKLAAVGKFAACVAHEIRSPLTAMRLWLFQIQEAAAGDPQASRSCRVLGEEIQRLENLATSFLEYSRPPRLELEPSDMSAIVQGTLEFAEPRLREKGIRSVRVNGTTLPPVMADARQLRQVLLNLVANAVEVTPEGGELRVTESLEAAADEPAEVVVRVADGGPGIPETLREHLFEPFMSTKPNGTGLGLSIASNIVSQHGGRLTLESSSGRGSVFAMRIPVGEVAS